MHTTPGRIQFSRQAETFAKRPFGPQASQNQHKARDYARSDIPSHADGPVHIAQWFARFAEYQPANRFPVWPTAGSAANAPEINPQAPEFGFVPVPSRSPARRDAITASRNAAASQTLSLRQRQVSSKPTKIILPLPSGISVRTGEPDSRSSNRRIAAGRSGGICK